MFDSVQAICLAIAPDDRAGASKLYVRKWPIPRFGQSVCSICFVESTAAGYRVFVCELSRRLRLDASICVR